MRDLHTIERWDDATGKNLVEEIASVGDFLVAMQTYLAAVRRWRREDHVAEPRAGPGAELGGLAGQLPLKGGGIIRSASCGTIWARRNTMAAARTTSERYCDDVNAVVDWIGHRLGLSTSSKWAVARRPRLLGPSSAGRSRNRFASLLRIGDRRSWSGDHDSW